MTHKFTDNSCTENLRFDTTYCILFNAENVKKFDLSCVSEMSVKNLISFTIIRFYFHAKIFYDKNFHVKYFCMIYINNFSIRVV